MLAYYNDSDPYCAQWLRNLIAAGLLPLGDVDERPIEEVQPEDVRDYRQCHWFGGLGGWPLALQIAGWGDEPIWTGSCPCQPFSVAGKRAGALDPRHLWPHFYRLIRASRPPVVFGEQVSGAAGYAWLDGVGSDLEAEDYSWRAVDIPACGVGAPHIRSRLYWVAERLANSNQRPGLRSESWTVERARLARSGERLAHGLGTRLEGWTGIPGDAGAERAAAERGGGPGRGLEHSPLDGRREGRPGDELRGGRDSAPGPGGDPSGLGDTFSDGRKESDSKGTPDRFIRDRQRFTSSTLDFWDSWDIVGPDPQGKFRRVGIAGQYLRSVVDGSSIGLADVCPEGPLPLLTKGEENRVNKLRALGNSLCVPLAAEVVKAYMEVVDA